MYFQLTLHFLFLPYSLLLVLRILYNLFLNEEYLKEEVDSIDKIISEDELVIIEPEMGVDYPGFNLY